MTTHRDISLGFYNVGEGEPATPLGIYISVPFCRTKCTYCNFASGVFSQQAFAGYVERVCSDIGRAEQVAVGVGGTFETMVDSIYLGGGTPNTLAPEQLVAIFRAVRGRFDVAPGAEITVECAPGTLSDVTLRALVECGVNRVSLGVQSFVDKEAAAVGRLHTRATALADIARLRAAGITNVNVDLIAGLPHQTPESWRCSVEEAIATGAPHVSVYMLEVDEDSRLGRELIAGGTRYHAHFVPDEDATAEYYQKACDWLDAAGVRQYEISNFARAGSESRHNLKYWTRQPYSGFGVDAHGMLRATEPGADAVRFAWPETLEGFLEATAPKRETVWPRAALEESLFLGLRLNNGVDLAVLEGRFGATVVDEFRTAVEGLVDAGLLESTGTQVQLTARGRLLSNEVFERFISAPAPVQ